MGGVEHETTQLLARAGLKTGWCAFDNLVGGVTGTLRRGTDFDSLGHSNSVVDGLVQGCRKEARRRAGGGGQVVPDSQFHYTHAETARARSDDPTPYPNTLLNVWGAIHNVWGTTHFVWSSPNMHGARSTVLYCTARI